MCWFMYRYKYYWNLFMDTNNICFINKMYTRVGDKIQYKNKKDVIFL